MSPDSISALRLSLQVAVAATALNALVGIPIAYALARRRFWGRSLVDLPVTLPLILPPLFAIATYAFLYSWNEYL